MALLQWTTHEVWGYRSQPVLACRFVNRVVVASDSGRYSPHGTAGFMRECRPLAYPVETPLVRVSRGYRAGIRVVFLPLEGWRGEGGAHPSSWPVSPLDAFAEYAHRGSCFVYVCLFHWDSDSRYQPLQWLWYFHHPVVCFIFFIFKCGSCVPHVLWKCHWLHSIQCRCLPLVYRRCL